MDEFLGLQEIEAERGALLADLHRRQGFVRDYVRCVAVGQCSGFYLFGRPGTAKTHTVTTVLEAEYPGRSRHQRGHLTPLGLFELIAEHADKVIVLDDLGAVLESKVAVQILLSALEAPSPRHGGGRVVKYRRQDGERRVMFYGGLVCISNLELHDGELLAALKSRVHVFKYDPPDAQIGALMLEIANRGAPGVPPEEAREVAAFVIEQMVRVGCRFDLRLFAAKALPVYRQWKSGGLESHWHDLVRASVEEHLAPGAGEAQSRAERIAAEQALARQIAVSHPTRGARAQAWAEQTGRSERAFYRRLR